MGGGWYKFVWIIFWVVGAGGGDILVSALARYRPGGELLHFPKPPRDIWGTQTCGLPGPTGGGEGDRWVA